MKKITLKPLLVFCISQNLTHIKKDLTSDYNLDIVTELSGLYSNPEAQMVVESPALEEGTSVYLYSKQEISRYECNRNTCEIKRNTIIVSKEDYMSRKNVNTNKPSLLDSSFFRKIVLALMIVSTVIINFDYIRNRDSGKAHLSTLS